MVLVLCCRLPCQLPHLVGILKKSSEVNYSKQSLIQRHPGLGGFFRIKAEALKRSVSVFNHSTDNYKMNEVMSEMSAIIQECAE
jgi:hypothetical protein